MREGENRLELHHRRQGPLAYPVLDEQGSQVGLSRGNPKWQTTSNRSWLVGLNSNDRYPDPFAQIKQMLGYSTAPGMTECIPAWRGLKSLARPRMSMVRNIHCAAFFPNDFQGNGRKHG